MSEEAAAAAPLANTRLARIQSLMGRSPALPAANEFDDDSEDEDGEYDEDYDSEPAEEDEEFDDGWGQDEEAEWEPEEGIVEEAVPSTAEGGYAYDADNALPEGEESTTPVAPTGGCGGRKKRKKRRKHPKGPRLYAVAVGRCPGIYYRYEDAYSQVWQVPGARYKSFPSSSEGAAAAHEFILTAVTGGGGAQWKSGYGMPGEPSLEEKPAAMSVAQKKRSNRKKKAGKRKRQAERAAAAAANAGAGAMVAPEGDAGGGSEGYHDYYAAAGEESGEQADTAAGSTEEGSHYYSYPYDGTEGNEAQQEQQQ
jgi:Caulimovirus viroplasmin